MTTEHRRPLYAFALVTFLCAGIVMSGLRSEALQGVLSVVGVQAVEKPVHVTVEEPAQVPTSADGLLAAGSAGVTQPASIVPAAVVEGESTPPAVEAEKPQAPKKEKAAEPATDSQKPERRKKAKADPVPASPVRDERPSSEAPGRDEKHPHAAHGRGHGSKLHARTPDFVTNRGRDAKARDAKDRDHRARQGMTNDRGSWTNRGQQNRGQQKHEDVRSRGSEGQKNAWRGKADKDARHTISVTRVHPNEQRKGRSPHRR